MQCFYGVDHLPRDEVIALLKQLLAGKGQQAVWTLRNRFSAWQRDMQGDRPKVLRRAVGDLRKNAEAAEKGRHEQEKRDRKKREIKRRKESTGKESTESTGSDQAKSL
jgi:hypothetical protein